MYYHQFCKIWQKGEIALTCPRWEFRILPSIWHSQPEGEDSIKSLIGNIRVVHVLLTLASIPFRGVHVLSSILSILWIWLQLRIGTAVTKWWPISQEYMYYPTIFFLFTTRREDGYIYYHQFVWINRKAKHNMEIWGAVHVLLTLSIVP